MAVPSLDVTVAGRAAGLTALSRIAEPWKIAVAQAVRSVYVGPFINEPCAIDLTFNVDSARMKDTAIYNLLKATIDELSNIIFAGSPSGPRGQWSREDWWITELSSHKRVTDSFPSVRIEVGSALTAHAENSTAPLIDIFMPGSPPLWPGDSVGQQKVIEWRAALQRRVQIPDLLSNQSLTIDFQFIIEPVRFQTADLDNFCVPAAQAVVYAVFGHHRHAPRISDIHAIKVMARSENDIGVRVQIREKPNGGQ